MKRALVALVVVVCAACNQAPKRLDQRSQAPSLDAQAAVAPEAPLPNESEISAKAAEIAKPADAAGTPPPDTTQPAAAVVATASGETVATPPAPPADLYFMSIYGYRGDTLINRPSDTHTWAEFLVARGGDVTPGHMESFTISWLAADLEIGIGEGLQPGRNLNFAETMAIAQSRGYLVSRTPLVQIRPELFFAARERFAELNDGAATGRIAYRIIDSMAGREAILNGSFGFSNCSHALADVGARLGLPLLRTGTLRGFDASYAVFEYFSPFVLGVAE